MYFNCSLGKVIAIENRIDERNDYILSLFSSFVKSVFICQKALMHKTFLLCVFVFIQQAFINYNFSFARFRAHKICLGARPCTWELVHVKEQTCMLLIT